MVILLRPLTKGLVVTIWDLKKIIKDGLCKIFYFSKTTGIYVMRSFAFPTFNKTSMFLSNFFRLGNLG